VAESNAAPAPDAPTATAGPWAPLRVRLFRFLWLAGVVSNIGTFMHTVGAGWEITSLTTNPTQVSLLQTMWTAPGFLFALLAGALADVVDRRRLMLITQFASVLIAALIGVLVLTDRLTVTALLGLTFALSTAGSLAAPAFMAVTPELVERPLLPQAVALNSISMNLGQAAGPALAGIVIAAAGPGAVFIANAVSFLGIVLVVRAYRPVADHTLPAEHIGAAMRTGVRYVRNSPRLIALASRVVLSLTVTSSLAALLPLIARRRLHVGAGLFGLLSTAMGLGAIAAVWVLPRLRRRFGSDLMVAGSAVIWAVGAAVLATTTSVVVACAGLALAGGAGMTTMTTVFAGYQSLLPAWVRGRASSVAMLVIWLGASIGSVGWGFLGSRIGVDHALLVAAASNVVVALIAGALLRIGDQQAVDVTQVHWTMPQLKVEPRPSDGPVMVTVEWRIDPSRAEEFAVAMAPVGRHRRRDGALQWKLFRDMADEGRMVESFIVATWAEHERQHHRTIAADAVEEQIARELLVGDGPTVSHLIAHWPGGTDHQNAAFKESDSDRSGR
jgi:MFS family permease/quinol monooxygenase YgiN